MLEKMQVERRGVQAVARLTTLVRRPLSLSLHLLLRLRSEAIGGHLVKIRDDWELGARVV
jgi:hypothetical protein